MRIKDLKPNLKNPRVITDEKLGQLKKAIAEFGDLSGIIFNKKTKQLIGGHQRVKLIDKNTEVVIEKRYPKKTKTGTLGEGYIVVNGERFAYREVEWDETKEKAANIAANKGAGEWDFEQLAVWMKEIDSFGFDLDTTMFDEDERFGFFNDVNFGPGDENDQGKLDKKKPIVCPHCGEEFTPGEK
jgi:hypothetical protein